MLLSVEPSGDSTGLCQYPCEVITDDGVCHRRVYLVEASLYIRTWGIWPWLDSGKAWLPAERITFLRSSPDRLAPKFANVILAAGESGMGYCAFSVGLRDGSKRHFVTGNAVDFPNWPADVTPSDVVAVSVHDRDRDHQFRRPYTHELSAEYLWSPFLIA